jgi:hypothetical protein
MWGENFFKGIHYHPTLPFSLMCQERSFPPLLFFKKKLTIFVFDFSRIFRKRSASFSAFFLYNPWENFLGKNLFLLNHINEKLICVLITLVNSYILLYTVKSFTVCILRRLRSHMQYYQSIHLNCKNRRNCEQ